jgi:hypothetical protein
MAPSFYSQHYIRLTYTWNGVLPEKLTGPHLLKKFPAFYGTRRFITVFTRVRHLCLSWARSFLSIASYLTSWRSILITSSLLHLGLPSGLFFSGLQTKTLYAPFLSPIRATCPARFIFLDSITRIILVRGSEYKAPRYVVFSTLLLPCPNIFLSILFLNTRSLCQHCIKTNKK